MFLLTNFTLNVLEPTYRTEERGILDYTNIDIGTKETIRE